MKIKFESHDIGKQELDEAEYQIRGDWLQVAGYNEKKEWVKFITPWPYVKNFREIHDKKPERS